MLNLWAPSADLPLIASLLIALLLGVVHGITPDEHTWPITFSYAIGSYSSRQGLMAGFAFSSAFTLQRALASELAYLALARWMQIAVLHYIVYLVVGAAMSLAGLHILRGRAPWHLEAVPATAPGGTPREIPVKLAAVHGFIAGWGVGAFATILYTVLAPSMPSPVIGWLPGFMFGIGTMLMQMILGALFGWWGRRLKLPADVGRSVAGRVAGRVLTYGGITFVAAGLLGLVAPGVAGLAITTPIHVHNLHTIGLGFALVILVVFGIGSYSLVTEVKRAARSLKLAS